MNTSDISYFFNSVWKNSPICQISNNERSNHGAEHVNRTVTGAKIRLTAHQVMLENTKEYILILICYIEL